MLVDTEMELELSLSLLMNGSFFNVLIRALEEVVEVFPGNGSLFFFYVVGFCGCGSLLIFVESH